MGAGTGIAPVSQGYEPCKELLLQPAIKIGCPSWGRTTDLRVNSSLLYL